MCHILTHNITHNIYRTITTGKKVTLKIELYCVYRWNKSIERPPFGKGQQRQAYLETAFRGFHRTLRHCSCTKMMKEMMGITLHMMFLECRFLHIIYVIASQCNHLYSLFVKRVKVWIWYTWTNGQFARSIFDVHLLRNDQTFQGKLLHTF